MNGWRAIVLVALVVLPVLLYLAAGGWALWQTGQLIWLWWVLPACWAVAYVLARYWQREMVPRPAPGIESPSYWTPQDEEAAGLIVARQEAVRQVAPQRLTDPRFYLDTALEMGLEISRVYHPDAKDPVESLTLPEILTAARLAVEDLENWFRQYVPGSHLLTVGQWQKLAKAPRWIKKVSDVSWIASMLLKLSNVGRYAVWRVAMEPVTRRMHEDVLAVFYIFYIRQVGFYLVEMNSGRLRGGAEPYREMHQRLQPTAPSAEAAVLPDAPDPASHAGPPLEVRVVLVGQTNSGKSSVVNAILGRQTARTDVLPETDEVTQYELDLPEARERVLLLDTPGYGVAGATRRQMKQTQIALREADLVLLVLNASNPARDPDRQTLNTIRQQLLDQQHLKLPPVIAVLTHIDCLSPAMEWEPPYNWLTPTHRKEESIRGAVDYTLEQLGAHLDAVAPVCSDAQRQRVYGVEQWLLPVIAAKLGEARGCAVLRALHLGLERGKYRKLFQQLCSAGQVLTALTCSTADGATRRDASG
jgi:predicted GTPase